MSITVRELRHDTYNFFSTQIRSILFICILIPCIGILIDMFFKPNLHVIYMLENNQLINSSILLELIHNMNMAEKYALLKYSVLKILELLISKTLLLGSIITLLSTLSNNKKESFILYIYSLLSCLPSVFILNFFTTLTIQLGFLILVIPGILLSILLSLSPIIFSFKKNSILDSVRLSIYISWNNIKIIGPGVLFWICGKFILTILLSHIYWINKNFMLFILNIGLNILFSILIIYLFRFYMLFIRSETSQDYLS